MSLTKNRYHAAITGEPEWLDNLRVSVWAEKDGRLALWVGNTQSHTVTYITENAALALIDDIRAELNKRPVAVTAADLGIEGAPV